MVICWASEALVTSNVSYISSPIDLELPGYDDDEEEEEEENN
jgi:hypothetical protein